MAHANNAVYLDWMEEAIGAAGGAEAVARHSASLSSGVRARRGRRRRAGIGGLAVRRRAGATGSSQPSAGERHLPGHAPSGRSRSDASRRTDDADRAPRRAGVRRLGRGSRRRATSRSRTAGSSTSGRGLDGDQAVDVTGRTILPGFFDCHTHVCFSNVDLWGVVQEPFSIQFFEAQANLRKTLEIGITSVRDAGGADLGIRTALERRDDRRPADADLDRDAQPDRRPRRRLVSVRRRRARCWSAIPAARRASSTGPTRCGRRSASCTGWAPT